MTAPPTYKKLNPADAPILILSARSDTMPLTLVDQYADSYLAQQISQISGVAQVALGGEQRPSIRVQVDPAKVASLGLTLEDIRGALVTATTDAPKGSLTTARLSFTIDANDQITDADQFKDVIVSYRNGAPIRVRDIGTAVAAATDRFSAAYHNNDPAILLSVYKQPGANVIDTVERIKELLPKVTAVIPPAIAVATVLDRTTTIRASVRDVEFTLVLTVVLVVLVVLLFLRHTWATLVPALTIALSLFGAFATMYLFGFSLDNLSLMALTIAIGFVVDDAIVEVENVYRHRGRLSAVRGGAGRLRRDPLHGAVNQRVADRGVHTALDDGWDRRPPVPGIRRDRHGGCRGVGVRIAVAGADAVRAFLHRNERKHGRLYLAIGSGFDAMLAGYRRTLDIVLRHRAITLAVFFATLMLTIVMAIAIAKGFFPDPGHRNDGGLAEAAQDVSPEEMMRLQRDLGNVLLRDPDVAEFASQTGSTGGNGNAQTANTARFVIALKPREQRKLSATQIIDRLRPQLAKVKGANLFLQATQDITVGGRSARASFQYTLQDPDIPELIAWSQKLLDKLQTLGEIADVSTDLLANAPHIKVTINRDQAARFGITPQAIDDTLNDAYRPAPDHPVFHPARHLLGNLGSGAGAAAKLQLA